MRFTACFLFLILVCCATSVPSAAQHRYFPEKVFAGDPKSNEYWAGRYSKILQTLNEPSLYQESKSTQTQSYRFLWVRSFHQPLSLRFEVEPNGTATLTIKKASGKAGSAHGHVTGTTLTLTRQQAALFLDQVNASGFWRLATHEDPVVDGPDGSHWIIEGVKDAVYHIVDRWSPESGPIRTLGLALAVELGRLKLSAKEIY